METINYKKVSDGRSHLEIKGYKMTNDKEGSRLSERNEKIDFYGEWVN